MTRAEREERRQLIRAGERAQAIANLYEANRKPARAQADLDRLTEKEGNTNA